jgi:5'-deoxynucleotidase YfbR-like HD superfamily hydrolase
MKLRPGAWKLIANACFEWRCFTIGRKLASAICRKQPQVILARRNAETSAFADIVAGVGSAESDYRELYKDYEERASLEARLVKAADVIDLLVQAYALERSGARGLDEFWQVARQPDFKLPQAADQVVDEVLQSLLQARSKIV